jgi:hypothetical protein
VAERQAYTETTRALHLGLAEEPKVSVGRL